MKTRSPWVHRLKVSRGERRALAELLRAGRTGLRLAVRARAVLLGADGWRCPRLPAGWDATGSGSGSGWHGSPAIASPGSVRRGSIGSRSGSAFSSGRPSPEPATRSTRPEPRGLSASSTLEPHRPAFSVDVQGLSLAPVGWGGISGDTVLVRERSCSPASSILMEDVRTS